MKVSGLNSGWKRISDEDAGRVYKSVSASDESGAARFGLQISAEMFGEVFAVTVAEL